MASEPFGWACERCGDTFDWTDFGFPKADAHPAPQVTPPHSNPAGVCGQRSGIYPPEVPTALAGITDEDFAKLIDHAKNRRMRSFHLRTTMNGVAVDLEGVFEPESTRKEPRRE